MKGDRAARRDVREAQVSHLALARELAATPEALVPAAELRTRGH